MREDIRSQFRGSWVERLVTLGTEGWYGQDRLGLIVANVTGYLVSISSLGFAVTYTLHHYSSLQPLVWGNVLLAAFASVTPLFHRFGRIAAGLWLSLIVFVFVGWFTSLLGRESGVMLNLIATAAVSFAILGLERVRLVAVICVLAGAIIIYSWMAWPGPAPGIHDDPAFMQQIFVTAIVSVMTIMFVVVYYAFYLARKAQGRLQDLMKSMMPDAIAERLMANEGETIAEAHEHVVVLFSDIVGFVEMSNRLGAVRVVSLLDDLFRAFDEYAVLHGVEKIKTIGDAYMVVCGLAQSCEDHCERIAAFACDLLLTVAGKTAWNGEPIRLRIGMQTGDVVAGVIGRRKFSYDLWGDVVNTASRMEQYGLPDEIQVTQEVADVLADHYEFEQRGPLLIKGKGEMVTFLLRSKGWSTAA